MNELEQLRVARCYDCEFEIQQHYRFCYRSVGVGTKYKRTKDMEECPFGDKIPVNIEEADKLIRNRVMDVEGITGENQNAS